MGSIHFFSVPNSASTGMGVHWMMVKADISEFLRWPPTGSKPLSFLPDAKDNKRGVCARNESRSLGSRQQQTQRQARSRPCLALVDPSDGLRRLIGPESRRQIASRGDSASTLSSRISSLRGHGPWEWWRRQRRAETSLSTNDMWDVEKMLSNETRHLHWQ